MISMKNLFLRALLALSILAAAPAALAGPVYRVSLNTSDWQGQSGYLNLTYGGLIGVGSGTAFASNFQGDFDDSEEIYHDNDQSSGNRFDGITLFSSENLAYVDQLVRFGGLFSFNVEFNGLSEGLASDFVVNLLDTGFNPLAGFGGITFTLIGGTDTPLPVEPTPGADVGEVPEPSEWLLVLTGLVLLSATRRFQRR